MNSRNSIAIGVAVLALIGLGPAAASAAPGAPAYGCHIISTATQTQSRDVTGETAAPTKYGPTYVWNGHTYRHVTRYTYSGVQTRTVEVVTTKCRGDESTTVAPTSSWTGASIVTATTTQRVR